jgi:hypothetical protein
MLSDLSLVNRSAFFANSDELSSPLMASTVVGFTVPAGQNLPNPLGRPF